MRFDEIPPDWARSIEEPLLVELDGLRAERDRFREALERISIINVTLPAGVRQIARDALASGEEHR